MRGGRGERKLMLNFLDLPFNYPSTRVDRHSGLKAGVTETKMFLPAKARSPDSLRNLRIKMHRIAVLTNEQGRIHGSISRVRVGRGSMVVGQG